MFAIFLKLKIFECIYISIYIYIHPYIYIYIYAFILPFAENKFNFLQPCLFFSNIQFQGIDLYMIQSFQNALRPSFYIYFFLFLHLLFPLFKSTFLFLQFPFFHLYILKQEEFSRFCFIQIFKVLKSELTKINFKFQHKGIESFPQT